MLEFGLRRNEHRRMETPPGKVILFMVGVACLAGLLLGTFLFKRQFVESWYLRKLRNGSERDRGQAAERLGRLRSEKAIPLLIEAFARNVDEILYANALSDIGRPALPAILKALKDPNDKIRAGACLSLIASEREVREDVLPEILAALKDGSVYVRYYAVVAIESLGEPGKAAIPSLEAALEDDPMVAHRARYALNLVEGEE
jgi:HEAT repeat protein